MCVSPTRQNSRASSCAGTGEGHRCEVYHKKPHKLLSHTNEGMGSLDKGLTQLRSTPWQNQTSLFHFNVRS